MTKSYSLVGTIASVTVDWMGEDTSRQDCYDETIAFALATFVDGTAITPRGYDETRQFDIHDTRSVLTDGGLSEFGVDCPEPEEKPVDTHSQQTATDTSEDYKFSRPQCRALTADGDRCSNPVTRGGSDEFCPRHVDADAKTVNSSEDDNE